MRPLSSHGNGTGVVVLQGGRTRAAAEEAGCITAQPMISQACLNVHTLEVSYHALMNDPPPISSRHPKYRGGTGILRTDSLLCGCGTAWDERREWCFPAVLSLQ
ncbi:hypothetical protein MRX96_003251 [Rhipicephalus microplus]